MTERELSRLGVAVVGMIVGYGVGRFLWIRFRLAVSFWTTIIALIVLGLLTERLFALSGLGALWEIVFYPLLVGFGIGLAVTSARPPRQAPWWQVWKV